jgi:hypothetical protein
MTKVSKGRELRIVLNEPATMAFEAMVNRMKETVPTVKVHPSHFVSFLLIDYMEAHFEKDLAVLVAEFFDSDAFHEAERRRAKGKPDFEELMQAALDRARQIKSKRRRKVQYKVSQPVNDAEVTP